VSVVMQVFTFISLNYIAGHANNNTLKFLANNECTFDDTINGSFKMVQGYMEKNESRALAIYTLFGIILVVDLAGIIHKVLGERAVKKDKYSKLPSGKGDVEMKEPITSI